MDQEAKIALTARTAHEVNRVYCEHIGDNTQAPWEQTPEWQRVSYIAGVRAQFDAKGELTPEESHEIWLRHKEADGWKFGTVKDIDAKEHPCMVPYAELSRNQQVKDQLFTAVCGAIHAGASA